MWRVFLLCWWPFSLCADTVAVRSVSAEYTLVRESLIEAIEAEGLVVGTPLAFADMLERTAVEFGRRESPLRKAEILPFCSARLAWRIVDEAPEQLANCPLSVALYERPGQPGTIWLAYRLSDGRHPARREADALLDRIVANALRLAR